MCAYIYYMHTTFHHFHIYMSLLIDQFSLLYLYGCRLERVVKSWCFCHITYGNVLSVQRKVLTCGLDSMRLFVHLSNPAPFNSAAIPFLLFFPLSC